MQTILTRKLIAETAALILDFDQTIALTSEPSPRRISVDVAYRQASEAIFGDAEGSHLFEKIGGGVNGRNPRAFVEALIHARDHAEVGEAVLAATGSRNLHRLVEEVEDKVGLHLRPGFSDEFDPLEVLTEHLVRFKLRLLIAEIRGREWPRPTPGFISMLAQLKERRIPVAIVSAGHEVFIREVFRQWGIKHLTPECMLTDDDLRPMWHLPHEMRTKPHRHLIDTLLHGWGQMNPRVRGLPRRCMLYVGDHPEKDGGLAHNAGTRFGLYLGEKGAPPVHPPYPIHLLVTDWNILSTLGIA